MASHITPSKKKHSETHGKSKADLILEKSPSLIKAMREKSRSNISSPKNESSGRSNGSTLAKSPSSQKLAPKDDSSDDSEEMMEKLRALDEAEAERAKLAARVAASAPAEDNDSDDDAPVAKSFKDVKKDAMELHQAEQDESRAIAAKKKDARRQRTQLLQEQSKKSQKKEKKRKVESSDDESGSGMDVEIEDFQLVPDSVLQQAVAQNSNHILMDEDDDNRLRIERRKQRKLEREIERQEKIDSKLVTVVSLTDGSGNITQQSRKAAAQSAEAFLKDHFWGGRLERMPADHYLSERIRGPAVQFVVPKSGLIPSSRKASVKENRRAEIQKRRR